MQIHFSFSTNSHTSPMVPSVEFDECPLSDLSLWGRVGTFVHHEEQERRFHAGLDPMTGEPAPYAGMFG